MKHSRPQETKNAPQTSPRRTSRRHRRTGRENRRRGQGRHTWPRASRENRRRGRGRYTRAASSANLASFAGNDSPGRRITGAARAGIDDVPARMRATGPQCRPKRAPSPSLRSCPSKRPRCRIRDKAAACDVTASGDERSPGEPALIQDLLLRHAWPRPVWRPPWYARTARTGPASAPRPNSTPPVLARCPDVDDVRLASRQMHVSRSCPQELPS
jgi:hypothetical protein